jgi:RluA family pseudouridine synthase
MQMRSILITDEYAGMTVEAVLTRAFSVSKAYLSRLKRRPRAMLLNGAPVRSTRRVMPGDTLSFDPSDGERLAIRPIPFPLDVAYEDAWLLVVNKPKHFSVHPARDPEEATLENAIAAYFTGVDNPHPVSRLDKDTTGLITVAKSGYVHALMKTVQAEGGFSKSYLAVTQGVPETPHFFIEAPIGAQPGSTYRRTVRSDGAPSKTECAVLADFGDRALVRLVPHTGRTHQLRVHMAYAGYPLLGDWLYGERSEWIDRPALHAETLAFPHPITHERIELSAPLPDDMRALIEQ